MPAAEPSATLALFGGGPFTANDDLDRRLLADAGADRVVVLPTAEAFEQPAEIVTTAMSWAERVEVDIDALMVFARHDAEDDGAADVIASASAVYLVGDSSIHLRTVLQDTPVYREVAAVLDRGGLVAAVGPCAAAVCDPMLDQRGGAFTLGLGLAPGMAVVPGVETWSDERLARTRSLADVPLAELPTGSAAVRRGTGSESSWELTGDVTITGPLP